MHFAVKGGIETREAVTRHSGKAPRLPCTGVRHIRRSTTVFSHSQTAVVCGNCQTVLCQPTGGRARLTEGCSFRRKGD
ncbi:40S ribosomal protein S27 [Musa troglodytarum]|uniref:40S ribosomal protein S27 n=1 Tax=Musa troglodytarum TaxID=320322 RepID=A0A9E7L7Y2_9LILI|nr:40S ribosomal protein S27 [Musa troglodytarum]